MHRNLQVPANCLAFGTLHFLSLWFSHLEHNGALCPRTPTEKVVRIDILTQTELEELVAEVRLGLEQGLHHLKVDAH